MSRRDCGCSDLITPTIEELLAVARKRPLPQIHERRPPPAKLGATLEGWMEWRLIDRKGREVKGGGGPNLILNQGLDQLATTRLIQFTQPAPATYFPIIRYCAVGTDDTTPDATQLGLGNEISRTDAIFSADVQARPSDGVHTLTRHIEFDYNQANGNLTEWGFSPNGVNGSNLFNRALFLDGNGDPDPVTKTNEFKLRITYTLQITVSPVDWTVASFNVANIGVVNGRYRLLGGVASGVYTNPCAAPDMQLFNILAMGQHGTVSGISQIPVAGALAAWPSDLSGLLYTYDTDYSGDSINLRAARQVTPRDAYVSGSFERTGGTWVFDTAYANLNPIKGFMMTGMTVSWDSGFQSCSRFGYAFDIDISDEFLKDNDHKLTIGLPDVTWGRAP